MFAVKVPLLVGLVQFNAVINPLVGQTPPVVQVGMPLQMVKICAFVPGSKFTQAVPFQNKTCPVTVPF